MANHCQSQPITDKLFSLNVSAPFLADFFLDQLLQAIERTDLLFANETEAMVLARKTRMTSLPSNDDNAAAGGDVDMDAVVKHIAALPYQRSSSGLHRTVVVTQGHLDVIVSGQDGQLTHFAIP